MQNSRFSPLFAAAVLAVLAYAAPARAENDPYAVCAAHVARAEANAGIPKGLLGAIAAVESGRWDRERRSNVAWPWTVTSGPNGQFFASKGEAIAEVRRMKAQGVRNIDVGCMQVNLHHHADAFDSLDDAFDPAANVAYAARFLRALYDAHQDWMTAASHYHSATPELGARYRVKVLAAWTGLSEEAAQERIQTADWTLVRPAQGQALGQNPAQAQVRLASLERGRPQAIPAAKAPPQPSQSEINREEARAFANGWREAKLAAYKNRKAQMAGNGA